MPSTKKYVINIDITGSKLHLNPDHYEDSWCNLDREKILSFGERREVTREEAIAYRSGQKPLVYGDTIIQNMSDCKNCSGRWKQSIHWDIP
jgi:hypothetical protein